ncbi:hypothetical protein NS263_07555 [Curtobacterium oceanosedimentum]|uniref:Uncharacterized protein n=1 Tax=Curtobacterium oceanosedimentum TaxID=465820 RepID=A0ABR5S7X6_9MICO|nr:hypothetical protein NS263_07555 [Curtobacterium oceanosedimentum]
MRRRTGSRPRSGRRRRRRPSRRRRARPWHARTRASSGTCSTSRNRTTPASPTAPPTSRSRRSRTR